MSIDWNVTNAVSRDVERQHLNKILADIRATINNLASVGTTNTTTVVQGTVTKYAIANFMLSLIGDVTGSAQVNGTGDVSITTTLDPSVVGVTEAPEDNGYYWRWNGQWQPVPEALPKIVDLRGDGFLRISQNEGESEVSLERISEGAYLMLGDAEQGEQGWPGPPGRDGRDGLQGVPGYDGQDGEDAIIVPGPMGAQGPIGPMGMMGLMGEDGEEGAMGPPGLTGATGATGSTGATGAIGPQGFPGFDGFDGEDGLTIPGPIGLTGATGATGSNGANGVDGRAGPPGMDGESADEWYPLFAGPLDLVNNVYGILASTYGGTGNGFTKFTGPASTEKTFTLPNASDTIACLGLVQTFTKQNTFAGGTITLNAPTTFTQTWNDGAVTFTGLLANFTATGAASASLVFDFQVSSTSQFKLRKDGLFTLGNGNAALIIDATTANTPYMLQTGGANSLRVLNSGGTAWLPLSALSLWVAALGTYGWGSSTNPESRDTMFGRAAANSIVFSATGVAGDVTSRTELNKKVTAIPNASATAVLTLTIPNAAHSGQLYIEVCGSLGAGGAVGANEATATNCYTVTYTRTAGVNAVVGISAALGASSAAVAGAATVTCTAAMSAVTGGVGASNSFTVNVTITRSGGSSTNHTCLVYAKLMNANATGATIA